MAKETQIETQQKSISFESLTRAKFIWRVQMWVVSKDMCIKEAFMPTVWYEEKSLEMLTNHSFYFVYYNFNIGT